MSKFNKDDIKKLNDKLGVDETSIDDEFFDLLFRKAVKRHLDESDEEYPPKDELIEEIIFSPKFENRMERQLRKWSKEDKSNRKKVSRFTNNLLKIAAVFLVVIIFSGAFIATSNAARVKILNFFKDVTDVSTEIITTDEQYADSRTIDKIPEKAYKPTYLPDGFYLTDVFEDDNATFILYLDNNGNGIQIKTYFDTNSISLDTENSKTYEESIKGNPAFLAESDKDSSIFIKFPENNVLLYSDISLKELRKVAESLTK